MPQQLKYINSNQNDQASIVNHRRKEAFERGKTRVNSKLLITNQMPAKTSKGQHEVTFSGAANRMKELSNDDFDHTSPD